jgi:hypothetical protein
MFGCHKCPHDMKSFPSYEESPCAVCATGKDPEPVSHFADDPATFDSITVMHPAYEESDNSELARSFAALGQCVRRLVSLKDKHPDTFKFVLAKMDKPALSYSELAAQFNCKKQNVMYHFKKAVGIMPELSRALIVARRFNGRRPSPLSPRHPKLRTESGKIA